MTSTRAGRSRDGRLGLAVPTDDHGAEPLPQHRLERARLRVAPRLKLLLERLSGLVSNPGCLPGPVSNPPCQIRRVKTVAAAGPLPPDYG